MCEEVPLSAFFAFQMNYLKTGRRETSRFPFLPPAKNIYLCARKRSWEIAVRSPERTADSSM
ncbi:hypothetical protein Barb4_03242 [Bacteroidales bacterium Barb4]|nr:hypothetical protein Barb4_03242 [Bacteroidales bacterium Barb4]